LLLTVHIIAGVGLLGELTIAGADTGPRVVALPAGTRTCGIRLRPGTAGALLGFPASELCDSQVGAESVWGERVAGLEEAMADATPARRLDLLIDAVARRGASPDAAVVAAVSRLAAPGASVAGVAADVGYSERQLRRRVLAAVGYGPKMLVRVAQGSRSSCPISIRPASS